MTKFAEFLDKHKKAIITGFCIIVASSISFVGGFFTRDKQAKNEMESLKEKELVLRENVLQQNRELFDGKIALQLDYDALKLLYESAKKGNALVQENEELKYTNQQQAIEYAKLEKRHIQLIWVIQRLNDEKNNNKSDPNNQKNEPSPPQSDAGASNQELLRKNNSTLFVIIRQNTPYKTTGLIMQKSTEAQARVYN